MTTSVQSLKSTCIKGLDILVKLRFVLTGILITCLGGLFGYLIDSPEAAHLIISIVAVFIQMVIIVDEPLNGMLVWLFFMVFIESWVNIPLGKGIPDLSFSRFTIAFLAIFMLAKAAIGKFRFVRISLADVSIIAATIGMMVSAPLSDRPIDVIQEAIALQFTPLVIYFFAKNLVQDKKDLHKVLWTLAILGTVAGAYTAYEYTTGNVLFLPKGKEATFLFRGHGSNAHIRIIRGLIVGAGNMGRALATIIPVTFYLFLERKKTDIRKILMAGMLAVQSCGIIMTMSRSPWYALLIALFVMQLFYPQFRKAFVIIVLVAAIIMWATWDQVNESDVALRVNDESSTLEGREKHWNAGVDMWKAKPIRGWGFGRYETESGRFRTDGSRRNFSAIENDYLYILVGSGLIGFLPYLTFLLAPLVNSVRLFFRARAPGWPGFIKPEALATYWAVILCFLITSYSAKQTNAVIKLMTFAVAGAIVGSHEYLLNGLRAKRAKRRSA
jgi:O-antigen ligase